MLNCWDSDNIEMSVFILVDVVALVVESDVLLCFVNMTDSEAFHQTFTLASSFLLRYCHYTEDWYKDN